LKQKRLQLDKHRSKLATSCVGLFDILSVRPGPARHFDSRLFALTVGTELAVRLSLRHTAAVSLLSLHFVQQQLFVRFSPVLSAYVGTVRVLNYAVGPFRSFAAPIHFEVWQFRQVDALFHPYTNNVSCSTPLQLGYPLSPCTALWHRVTH
jgi:hypothetical protein